MNNGFYTFPKSQAYQAPTSASYALTASYALNGGGGGAGFPFSGSAVITGSLVVSGSGLTVTGSFGSSKIIDNGTRVLINNPTDNNIDDVQVAGSVYVSGVIKETVNFNRRTSSYILDTTDRGKLVEMNSGSANTLTIPSSSVANFDIGSKVDVVQYGAGITSITSGSTNVTLRSNNNALRLNGQFAAASLIKVATDEWYVIGNLIN